MRHSFRNAALAGTILGGALAAPTIAQESETGQPAEPLSAAEVAAEEGETITVTGSRLRRNEFSSISPLQVIDASEARLFGVTDTTELISQSPVIAGSQLDGTVNAGSPTAAVEGVPANGPGASTIALRGLGAERTLLLVNGRRLAPSGVRGAPVAPDLNLIPSALIDRVDILTDGASAVYGADAVAGVVNIILRDEFEGLEFSAFTSQPEDKGGEVMQFSMIGGASNDRSNFTVAAEYYNRNAVLVGDRDFNDCVRDIELGSDGNIYSACLDGRPDNAAFVDGVGFVFNTPGETDIGAPGWTSSAGLRAQGRNPAAIDDFNLQDEERATQLVEGVERFNIFATGRFDLDFWERDSFYFELSYNSRSSVGRFTSEQVFPGQPALIPQVDANGDVVVDGSGDRVLVDNPLNPFDVDALPVITVQGLSQRRSTDLENFRAVGGLEGDVGFAPMMERGWVYDISASYDRSLGVASQPILFESNLREASDTLFLNQGTGSVECGLERTALSFGFITPNPCVPINWFASSLYTTQGGDKTFATQAETDFLFGDSINTTEIEQVLVSAFLTGELFELPAGPIGLVFGGEFREQRINSVNDIARTQGVAASEVPDIERNTVGRTSLAEFFLETEIPLHERLSVNAAGRYTEEENFGAQVTYSVKGDFRATDFLALRATYGTTFRAPNLREQFLAGAAGTIGGGADPCIVPSTAQENDVYVPGNDERPQVVLDNCVAAGADPTQLGLLAVTGIPTNTGGSTDLSAETSESLTAGFLFNQTFTDAFDFDLVVSYFDVEVNDTVEESNPAEILRACYNDEPGLASPFCDRITRNTGNPATATIASVDASFINVGLVTTTGVDVTARYGQDLDRFLGGTRLDVTFQGTHYIEQLEQIDPDSPIDDNVGEVAVPEFAFNTTATLSKGNWRALWRLRYIDDFQQDDSEDFAAVTASNQFGSACGAVLGFPTDVTCRDVDYGDAVVYNDLSLSYDRDDWRVSVGVSNVFNEEPPLVDQGEAPARSNIVVQSGYDLYGRRAFVGLTKTF